MNIYIYIFTYTYTFTFTDTYTYTCTYIYIFVYLYFYAYIHKYVYEVYLHGSAPLSFLKLPEANGDLTTFAAVPGHPFCRSLGGLRQRQGLGVVDFFEAMIAQVLRQTMETMETTKSVYGDIW